MVESECPECFGFGWVAHIADQPHPDDKNAVQFKEGVHREEDVGRWVTKYTCPACRGRGVSLKES